MLGVTLVRIFPHLDWIRRDTPYLSVSNSNAGKCELDKLRIQTLFTQWDSTIIGKIQGGTNDVRLVLKYSKSAKFVPYVREKPPWGTLTYALQGFSAYTVANSPCGDATTCYVITENRKSVSTPFFI